MKEMSTDQIREKMEKQSAHIKDLWITWLSLSGKERRSKKRSEARFYKNLIEELEDDIAQREDQLDALIHEWMERLDFMDTDQEEEG